MYDGIPYGRYLDTSSCRVSVDNIRLKFTYKYQNFDYEKKETILSIDQLSKLIDNMFFTTATPNGLLKISSKLALTAELVPSPAWAGLAPFCLAATAMMPLVSKSLLRLSLILIQTRFLRKF